MPTPYRTEYVTLGGLMSGSRAIDCYDWSDLEGTADKKVENWPNPGGAGVLPLPAPEDGMRALLHYRVDGSYDQDNNIVSPGTDFAGWRTNFYTLMAAVRAVTKLSTVQTLQLTVASGGPHSADCLVIGGIKPAHEVPWLATFTVDVLLPDGSLL